MKTANLNPAGEKALDIARGRAGKARAGTPGPTFIDTDGGESTSPDIYVYGATVLEDDDLDATILTITGGGIGNDTDGGVTDGTTSVSPVTSITVPDGGLTDLGSGAISLHFLTNRNGEQHTLFVTNSAGSTLELDLGSYNFFDLTLDDDCTLTFADPPPSGVMAQWTILLRQGTGAPFTVTWPAAVEWADTDGTTGGAAPTLYTAEGAQDEIVITTLDGGVSYGGSQQRSAGASVGALDDLSDVTITSPASGDGLRYIGGVWINANLHDEPMIATDGTVMVTGTLEPMMHEVAW